MQDLTGLGQALDSEVARKFYEDSLSPAAKPLGLLLRDGLQTVRLGLLPFQLFALGQTVLDKFLAYVAEKISPENLIAPAPEVAGPVLQGMMFVGNDNPVREMFAELLARACDKTRVADAHPAFAKIIDQLSPDEAVILQAFKTKCEHVQQETTPPGIHLSVRIKDSPQLQQLIAPQHVRMYIDHLSALNVFTGGWTFPNDANVLGLSAGVPSFGVLFMDACVPGDWQPGFTQEMRASIYSRLSDK